MTKSKLFIGMLASVIMVGTCFGANTSLTNSGNVILEESVTKEIQTFYTDLLNKYNKGEIKKEKILENLRNRIYILKEKYGNKLSDEFYENLMKIADSIGTTKQIKLIAKDPSSNKTKVKTQTLNQNDQELIKKVVIAYIKKLNNKSNDEKTIKINNLIKKIDKILEQISKDSKKVQIKLALEYMKTLLTNYLTKL